jgi:Flp pilus assembly protein TadG
MRIRHETRRRGATVAETALVLAVFCMLMFGAFEYCRWLYVLHITNNAARDAARYAVVNVDKPTNFDTVDYNGYTNITSYATARMGGTDKQLNGYRVAVFAVDPVGQTLSPPVVRPKSLNPPTYPDPFAATDPNKVPWNQSVFTQDIAVTIDGTYTPLLPTFLLMPSSLRVTITSVAGSEG